MNNLNKSTLSHRIFILKKNKTKKNKQKGGKEPNKLEETSNFGNEIKLNSKIKVIGPKDINYPSRYIGYNVLDNDLKLDDLINDAIKTANFTKNNGELDLYKLDDQVLKDIKREIVIINNNINLLNAFKEKDKNASFKKQLNELSLIKDPLLFNKGLLELFPDLKINEEENNAIQHFANENLEDSISNYWAILPFYDEIINQNGITDMDKINKIKLFSQQSISTTMMDILNTFLIPRDIFYSLYISGSFNYFGSKSNEYISKINGSLLVDVNLQTNIIVQNKLYYSIVNVENEFGLGVISTCMYFDINNNKMYLMWKVERWRNVIIKEYYNLILRMFHKSTPIPEDLMQLMEINIYNNKICDFYPLTYQSLFNYYETIIKSIKRW